MAESLKDLGRKGLALLILLVAAYVLFKIVVGVASAVVWIAIVTAVVVAAFWALAQLR
jgi:flagellar biosynthesis protein FliQ